MSAVPIPVRSSVLLLLAVQALSLASAGAGELLKNGDFRKVGRRSGPWQQPRHWGMWESGKSKAEIDLTGIGIESEAGPNGQPALMVRGRGACFLQSVRGVQPGTRLRLTFWAMAELENGQLNVSLRFLGADGGYLPPREQPKSGSIVFRKSFGWRLCEADVQAPAAIGRDIVNVIVAPRLSGADRAGLAAISLQIVPAAGGAKRDDGKPLGFLSAKALPDIQVDLPTADDSIAYLDLGTGEGRRVGQVVSDGPAKRTEVAGRACAELAAREVLGFRLEPGSASALTRGVMCCEFRNSRQGRISFSYWPADQKDKTPTSRFWILPGATLGRWRVKFFPLDALTTYRERHFSLGKRAGILYLSRVWVKRFSPAEIEAWDTYSEWLDSVSIRYTQLASGIEFLREELRQFRRANGFAGSGDSSGRLQWAEDGLGELFRAAHEIRYAFALAEEEGRRDCVLGDDAYRDAQAKLEARLAATLTQAAELRKRVRELQDRLDARLAEAHPWVRKYAIAPPRLPAKQIGDAPVFCATQSHAVDWEPIQHLALDGVQVQTWAHSLSMVKSCLPDGSFDFSNFDDTLEEAAQHGARISVWVLAGGGPGALLPYVLPRWFRSKHRDDLHCRDEAGKIYKGTISMWHPAVRTMYRDFVGAFAERYKNDPRVVAYHFLDEASPNPRAGLMGYSATARAAFRKYLTDKYETIAALNAVWGSRYRDFADIDPPPEGKRRTAIAGTPHVNEFALFIDRSWQDFMNGFIDAFRAHDTMHPIAGQALNLGIDPTAQRWTAYGVNTGGGVGKHHFEYRLNRTYVVNRHVKDRLTYHLAWWAMDEGDYGAVADQIMRNVYLRNLWQIFMWDSVGATLYSMRYRRDGWNMLDKATDYRLIRDSVATTPVMKSKLARVWPVLRGSRVAKPRVCLVSNRLSSTLCRVAPRSKQMVCTLYQWLRSKHRASFIVPEAVIADGREDLSGYRALICQHGTHHLPGLSECLLKWVEKGGCLVLLGPEGLYSPLGKPDGRLMRKLFGVSRFEYAPAATKELGAFTLEGQTIDLSPAAPIFWAIRDTMLAPHVNTLARFDDGTPAVLHARHGQGEALYCPYGIHLDPAGLVFLGKFLDERLPVQMAWCDHENVELMTREDDRGRRYLAVTHYDPERPVALQVALGAIHRQVADLCTATPTPVPTRIVHGLTTFNLDLLPGEGTVVALGPPESRASVPAVTQHAYLSLLKFRAAIPRAEQAGLPVADERKLAAEAEQRIAAGDLQAAGIGTALANLEKCIASGHRDKIARLISRAASALKESKLSAIERARREAFFGMVQKAFRDGHVDVVPQYLAELASPGFLPVRERVPVDLVCRRVAGVTLDGRLDEWTNAEGGSLSPEGAVSTKPAESEADLSARFKTVYDAENLYFAVTVTDDVLLVSDKADKLWEADCVELYLDFLDDDGLPDSDTLQPDPAYGPDDVQLIFSARGMGSDKAYYNPIGHFIPEKRAAAATRPGGYTLEIAIPWRAVPLRPVSGLTIGLNVRALDTDAAGNIYMTTAVWKRDTRRNHQYTTGWGRMRLE